MPADLQPKAANAAAPTIGQHILRIEDQRFLTGEGAFVANINDPLLDGAVHLVFVRSVAAHAMIRHVETSAACAAPGVVAVLTAADLGFGPEPTVFAPEYKRSLLATDVVRFVGEAIAIVVSSGLAQGQDAAELVIVDYDPLPAVVDPQEAGRDAILLFPEVGTNACADGRALRLPEPDPSLFDGCEIVVDLECTNQRLAPCPLEVRGAAAAWTEDGRLVQWASSQHPHRLRAQLQQRYGEGARPRVIVPDVGGGFGAKAPVYPEDLLLGAVAAHVGRPVRWQETRSESMQTMLHGRGQRHHITIGGTRMGDVQAYRLEIIQDCGAYPEYGALIPGVLTRPMASSVYDIARVECHFTSVLTNTTPVSAYRGAGRPEAIAAIERVMDVFAAEIGLDPVEVRRRNLIPPFDTPHTTPLGSVYDNGDYVGALERVLAAGGYDMLREDQSARRERDDPVQLGIGVSCYVEVTGQTADPRVPGSEVARVAVDDAGGFVVRSGTTPIGQGHDTSWAMIAAERLGVAIDRITVVHGDTDLVPAGSGTFASRSAQQCGLAIERSATILLDRARRLAGKLLHVDPDRISPDPGAHGLRADDSAEACISWLELARVAAQTSEPLDVEETFVSKGPTYPFGAHLAVVEVDTDTGKVELIRFHACDDAGRILNPAIAQGQIQGGTAQGIAQALLEEVRYDEDGNPLTSNFADYAFISAAELPLIDVIHMETPTPYNVLGVKGVGESGTIGAAPAVQSAVIDALAPFGVGHIDMPLTPVRVWEALRAVRAE